MFKDVRYTMDILNIYKANLKHSNTLHCDNVM